MIAPFFIQVFAMLQDEIVRAAVRLVLIDDGYVDHKTFDEQKKELRDLFYKHMSQSD